MASAKFLLLRLNAGMAQLLAYQPETAIGGQAVIEGVLMRSAHRLSVAVRAPDGSIALQSRPFTPFSRRFRLLGWPILRGAASLIESLYIGIQALNWSAGVQETTPEKPAAKSFSEPAGVKKKALAAVPLLISFALALALFQLLPYAASAWIVGGDRLHPQNPLLFNGVAGAIRMVLLLTYMWGLSHLPDISRVFQYHGAEHKSIFAYERKRGLGIEQVAGESRFHPRCGTSFILIVALVCVFFFSLFDSLLQQGFGIVYPNFFARFLTHLPFIPLVAGLSFEVLKLSARFQDAPWVRPLILPGLWLQHITTREPDASQLEVAVASVKASLA